MSEDLVPMETAISFVGWLTWLGYEEAADVALAPVTAKAYTRFTITRRTLSTSTKYMQKNILLSKIEYQFFYNYEKKFIYKIETIKVGIFCYIFNKK
jgi:hypothetical protein